LKEEKCTDSNESYISEVDKDCKDEKPQSLSPEEEIFDCIIVEDN